jgi:8-oxo-dGTP diphosphatase
LTDHLRVVGAVIVDGRHVLCAQRSELKHLAGMWEFPGGKVEPGESDEQALEREIREELGCLVHVGAVITTTLHRYDFGGVALTTYYCEMVEGLPHPSEHQAVVWTDYTELKTLDWAPADVPAVERVMRDLDGLRPSPPTATSSDDTSRSQPQESGPS